MPSKAFRQIYKTKICEKLEWASIFEKFVGHAIYISENLRLEKTLESLIGRGFRGFPFKHYIQRIFQDLLSLETTPFYSG